MPPNLLRPPLLVALAAACVAFAAAEWWHARRAVRSMSPLVPGIPLLIDQRLQLPVENRPSRRIGFKTRAAGT